MTKLEAIVTEDRIGNLTLVIADMREDVLYYRNGYDTGTKLKEDIEAFTRDPESWAEWDGNQLDEIKESVRADPKHSMIQDPVLLEKICKEASSRQLHDYMHGDMDGDIRVVANAYDDGEITMWTGEMEGAAMEALLDMPKVPKVSEYHAAVTEDNAGRLYLAVAQYGDQIMYIGTNYEERGSALKEDIQAFIKDPACWKEWGNDDLNKVKDAIWKDIEGLEEAVSLPEYQRREMFYEKMSAYIQGGIDGELNDLKVVAEINSAGAYTLKTHEMGLSSKKALLYSTNVQATVNNLPAHKADTEVMDKIAEARDIAKKHLGDGAIVTSAFPGRTYSGEIIGIVGDGSDKTVVQAISENQAVLHDIKDFSATSNIRIGEDVTLSAEEFSYGYSFIQNKNPEAHANKNEMSREGLKR